MKKRFKIALCVLCTLFLIPMVVLAESGIIYYVANDGNDENSGTSPDDAWQTLDKLNSEYFAPGNSILFKRNDHWRGQLIPQSGSSDGYVTYGAYDTGDKPLLLGSIELNDLNDWVYEGNDIWATTKPEILYDIGNIIFNNEQIVGVKKWYEEDLDTQGDFWYDKKMFVIKIYSINNPASHYSDIECALTRCIIDESTKSYVIYENLELKYGGSHGIGGWDTHHIIVRDCNFSYMGGGELEGEGRLTRYGNGVEFWGNAHDNLVERCRIWEIYDSALTNQNSEPNVNQYNIRYQNNVIWNCEYSYEFWNYDENSFMYDISFVNNSCAYAGGGWGHSQRPDPWGLHVVNWGNMSYTGQVRITHNIFYESTDNCIYIHSIYGGLENLDLGYNCWYQVDGDMINYQDYHYTMSQFSKYQLEKLQDQNSIAVDPLFVNPLEFDFHLQENSLAIDSSSSFDAPEDDFDRNRRPEGIAHDMGACEFVFNVPGNIPPTADAGPDVTVDEGEEVPLDGSGSSDPDDGIVAYFWEQTGGPEVDILDPTDVQTSFIAPDLTSSESVSLTFELTVQDSGGLIAKDTCVVVVASQPSVPGTATLLSPSSITKDKTPTYTWNAVEGATMYLLYVEGPSGTVIEKWYDAYTITSGDTCSVTPDVTLAKGKYSWGIRASNDNGYGDWSNALLFKVVGKK